MSRDLAQRSVESRSVEPRLQSVRIHVRGDPHDRLFLVVHFVCAVLAFGAGRAAPLPNCLAATAAIQDCRNRGARPPGAGMGCCDVAGPPAERTV